jgi:hypothetical protein
MSTARLPVSGNQRRCCKALYAMQEGIMIDFSGRRFIDGQE